MQSGQKDRIQLTITALAALVMRQARQALIEGRMVCGVDRVTGALIGLKSEDRKAMALVSRLCLSHGLPDHGAEIHQLLALSCRPMKEWLPPTVLESMGWGDIVLIDGEDLSPTAEAEELASGFSTVAAGMEEMLFQKLVDLLDKQPSSLASSYYTNIREFVIRHPIAKLDEIRDFGAELTSSLWACLQQFYEPIPEFWSIRGKIPICAHCRGAMRLRFNQLACRSTACSMSNPTEVKEYRGRENLVRVSHSIRQYWVEPGIDEIRLFDALIHCGKTPRLYPNRDRVDIEINDVGIDLKAYTSPELLAWRLNRSIGGLAFYERKWLVIPDWLAQSVPAYVRRVSGILEGSARAIRCLTLSDALGELSNDA
ncbi:hypothetical protein [Cupriavidus sp. amp6]|uniref:restriction endonuclease-related protein n=1 Tax=Cupriavidus sp. amp6 TaxID=388051 RepID=UPI0012EBF75D|nr:hypothetical protein [Cupriavidus sp. amp6]